MTQKIVSFNVAKAIKDAGYPQGPPPFYDNSENLWKDGIKDHFCHSYYAPTYLDVWLWLWREKGIRIDTTSRFDSIKGWLVIALATDGRWTCNIECSDPEEVIIATIDYLVDHDLI